jgi:hypothetical protein
VGRTLGGVVLLLVSAFMLLGFVRSGASFAALNTMIAVLLVVVLPAVGGVALLRSANRIERRGGARMQQLRQATIEAEILRLAMLNAGRLTTVEVASALSLQPEEAKETLDGLVTREVADLDITDAGVLVYTFHDAKHVADKHSARGLLDA